jgi:streptomycin 6-kinase
VEILKARYGFVVSVETADGRSLVLKSTPDPAGELQAAAAERLAKLAIGPTVHEVVGSDVGTWTVMDLVQPGTRAIRSSSLDELAELLRPLVAASPAPDFPPISAWLRERLLDDGAADLPPGVPVASPEERARALPILDDLVTAESHSLCHGDVSSGNVLRGPHGLQLIDPRAVSGDVEYDSAVVALKAGQSIHQMARCLEVDVNRAEAWGVVAVAARV